MRSEPHQGQVVLVTWYSASNNYNNHLCKLLFIPGFICPVHTPDGAPCGLLNHLSKDCTILNEIPENPQATYHALIRLGMTPTQNIVPVPYSQCLEVVLDGGLVGYIGKNNAEKFAKSLRILKTQEKVRNSFVFHFSLLYLFGWNFSCHSLSFRGTTQKSPVNKISYFSTSINIWRILNYPSLLYYTFEKTL